MAESRTARMRLVQWSSGTDSPQRVDFNETFLNIETQAAIDQQGALLDRPLSNKTGMYYFATDQGILYRSDGTSWAVVGSSTLSHLVKSARTDSVALTIQAITSQSADLARILTTTGATLARVRSNGDLLVGALRVSQASRTTTVSDIAPTDSAVTVDNASASTWGHTVKSTTGNTAGSYRSVRGTTTVFSVGPDGTVTTPTVVLTAAPSATTHATTKGYVDTLVSTTVYPLDGGQFSGSLPVAKGGTGGTTEATARAGIGAAASATTIGAGTGLQGGGTLAASRTLAVVFAGNGSANTVARSDHGHALTDANLTGTLPINQGGTGATTHAAARTALNVPYVGTTITAGTGLSGGGDLAANRTFSVDYAGNGTANSAARSDHTHDVNSTSITGTLSVAGGGTGRSSVPTGAYLRGDGTGALVGVTPANLLADIDAATSGHGHALTDANITGTLPVAQGGTGATTTAAARTALAVPVNTTAINTGNGLTGGGNLTASRTLSVDFAGTGSANTVARSNHTHNLADSTIIGSLPWAQFPDIIPLGGAVDLNDQITTALYHQSANAGATNGTNYPTNNAGLLDVKAYSSMVYQTYYSYVTSSPRTFRRTKYGAVWGSWVEIADNTDIAALVNVYAAKVHGHSLTDANITGTLPLAQGGTGATNAAAARTALAVPSTSIAVTAGAGLSGGGTLAASRTLQVVFEGSGTKSTSARSDHGHALTDANVTGTLPVTQGGTGITYATAGTYLKGDGANGYSLRTTTEVRSDIGAAADNHGHALTDPNITGVLPIAQGGTGSTTSYGGRAALEAAYVNHGHALTDANITGILPVSQGGTGRANLSSGAYLIGNGTGIINWVSKADVRADIGAMSITERPYRVQTGSAAGWSILTNGISVTPHSDGSKGCSMEVTMSRTDAAFTLTDAYMVHGYFVPTELRPTHVPGQYFWANVNTVSAQGYLRWSDGALSTRAQGGTSISVPTSRSMFFQLSWIVL